MVRDLICPDTLWGLLPLCESLLKKSPLCVGCSPDWVAPEGHGAQGEGPFQSPGHLGTWTPRCWVSMGLPAPKSCLAIQAGLPVTLVTGPGLQRATGWQVDSESTLIVRHCRGHLSGRPLPKAPKARSAASAHRRPSTQGQVITEADGDGVGWIWGPA